jgi:hypothetical protein
MSALCAFYNRRECKHSKRWKKIIQYAYKTIS